MEIWETTEREDRKDIEDSLVYRDFLDHLVQQVNRETLESLDPVANGDPLDQSDHQEKRGTLASLDPWAPLELEESVVTLDQRDPQERQDHQVLLAPPDPPPPPWTTCLGAPSTTTPAPRPLPNWKTRPCPTATLRMPSRRTLASRPP